MNIRETQHSDGTIEVTVGDKGLTCLVCGNNRFDERKSLLNTRAGELFNVAWLDAKATNFICTKCGYIFWFMV